MSEKTFSQHVVDVLREIDNMGAFGADFNAVDAALGDVHTDGDDQTVEDIGDLLEDQVGPVFDEVPRAAAMYALFMYGVIVGQRVAAKGVLVAK